MKLKFRDPTNLPVFSDPYLADTNAPRDKDSRRQNRMVTFWIKENVTDEEAILPISTGAKVRRGVLIFLGVCIAVAAIVCGIYVVSYWFRH